MRRPPHLQLLTKYPATGGLALMAAAVTLMWVAGRDVSPLVVSPQISYGEPWRLLTSILPHIDIIHILFNLYWLWALGSLIEEVWGPFRTLCIFLALAIGSSAAEFAVGVGGVGLSGVVYGLFGMLWVLTHNHRRFYLVIDRQTTQLFVGWFFLCIVLTWSGTLNVGNVAHGSGAVLGFLLGKAISHRSIERRQLFATTLAAATLLAVAGATVARPYINRSPEAAEEVADFGYEAIENRDYKLAASAYERAVLMNAHEANWWHNLGAARQHLNRLEEALSAFKRSTALDPDDPLHLYAVAFVCKKLGRSGEADHAFNRAHRLDQGDAEDGTLHTPNGEVGAPQAIESDKKRNESADPP